MLNALNMEGINYPVSIHDRDKFEKQNPSVSVLVFGYDYFDGVYPLSISKQVYKREHHVDLLLLEKDGIKHYCILRI